MKWIKMGWGKEYSSLPDEKSMFYLDYSGIKNSKAALDLVAKKAIEQITKEYPPPYNLMCSGGIDSQTMMWLWKQSDIPFTVTSFKYVYNDVTYNDHDLVQLDQFTSQHNIPVKYYTHNPIQFFEEELLSYAVKFQCTSPQICTHMKISEQITNGTVIFSGDFGSHNVYTYTMFGLKRYTDISKRPIIPFFFLHDAELAGTIKDRSYNINGSSSYNNKVNRIRDCGIPIIPQEQKYTGFEQIKDFYDKQHHRVTIRDKIEYSTMPSKRVFDVLFRYRLMNIVKYKDTMVYV